MLVMGGKYGCRNIITNVTGMVDDSDWNIAEDTLFIDFEKTGRFS